MKILRNALALMALFCASGAALADQAYPKIVANVTALQNLLPAAFGYVETLGYNTPGDGGKMLYRYNAADATTVTPCGPFATSTGVGRWDAVPPTPFPLAACGIVKGSGNAASNTVAFQAALNLGIPLIGVGSTEWFVTGGFTYDANSPHLRDCAGDIINDTQQTSGVFATATFSNGDPQIAGGFGYQNPFSGCQIFGPTASVGVDAFACTPMVYSSQDFAVAWSFDHIGIMGFRNAFDLCNGVFWFNLDHFSFSSDTGINCQALINMTGASNAGERNSITNGSVSGCSDFVVDKSGNSNADTMVDNVSLDGLTRFFTGDSGGGPGTTGATGRLYFSHPHIESVAGTDYLVNLLNSGSATLSDGEFLPINAPSQALFKVNTFGSSSGLTVRNMSSGYAAPAGDETVDGTGAVIVDRNGSLGAGGTIGFPFIGQSNNLIPNYTFPASPLTGSVWSTNGSGIASYNSTTAPPASGNSPAGVGNIKLNGTSGAVLAQVQVPCAQGHNALVQWWLETSGEAAASATFTVTLGARDASSNNLGSATTLYSLPASTDFGSWILFKSQSAYSLLQLPAGTANVYANFNQGSGSNAIAHIGKPAIYCQ